MEVVTVVEEKEAELQAVNLVAQAAEGECQSSTTAIPKFTCRSSSSGGRPVSGLQGGKSSASSYGNGNPKATTISSGLFSGRTIGGGTRGQVYGNRYVL